MKHLFIALLTGAFLFACNSNTDKHEAAKNSDWTTQNLKGMVQTMEESSYTPDSTGAIGEMDSCCISTDMFDENGYVNSSVKKDSKGNISEETTITRYEKGQAKNITTTKDGKTSGGFAIDIDAEGKYSGARELDSAGNMTFFYTELTEDEYGAVTHGIRHKADSSVDGTFTSAYNKGIQVSNTYADSSGKEVYNAKSELNDKGDIAKTTSTSVEKDSSTTKVVTFTYDSYDEQGNWTQRTTYDDKGKATKVTKRSYTYIKKE